MRNPVDLAHLFADIMNSHDPYRFAELVSEDYVNHNPGVRPGRAGLVAFMGHWFETLSDTRVTVEDAFGAGDRVVGRYTYRARHTGSFVGVPASGADIIMRSIDISHARRTCDASEGAGARLAPDAGDRLFRHDPGGRGALQLISSESSGATPKIKALASGTRRLRLATIARAIARA